ncbi:MAG: hypothetical protein ACI9I0_000807 [Rhodoferax sp.]|jgi:hypothetical protein
MLDHVFLSVTGLPRSISFYKWRLAPLDINPVIDYDGANGPAKQSGSSFRAQRGRQRLH